MKYNINDIRKYTWTITVDKTDKRCKLGTRRISTSVWHDRDEASILREVQEIRHMYSRDYGYVINYLRHQYTSAIHQCDDGGIEC